LADPSMDRIRAGRKTADGTTYVLLNYDTYQTSRAADGAALRAADEPDASRTRAKIEAGKAGKAGKQNPSQGAPASPGDETRGDDKSTKGERRPLRRCPAEWQHTDEHRRLAVTLGVDVATCADEMRDHTFPTGRMDWDATFRNWLREAARRQNRGRPAGASPVTAAEREGEDATRRALRLDQEREDRKQREQDEREAWRVAMVAKWEGADQVTRARIRKAAEAEYAHLTPGTRSYEKSVRWRCLTLLADEIKTERKTA
ncbi:MAG TPA: hypothetical protein VIB55_01290, partial [Longimicrobium sp.]